MNSLETFVWAEKNSATLKEATLICRITKETKMKSTVIRTAVKNICHCLPYHQESYELIQNYLIFCLIIVNQQTTPTSAGRADKHENCGTSFAPISS